LVKTVLYIRSKGIRLENRINKSNYNIEEVFIEEEAPKEEAIAAFLPSNYTTISPRLKDHITLLKRQSFIKIFL